MLLWLRVEFAHLLVKLVHLLIAYFLAVEVRFCVRDWALRFSLSRFQVVDLSLYVGAFLLKSVVFEHSVSNFDAKLILELEIDWVSHPLTKFWVPNCLIVRCR